MARWQDVEREAPEFAALVLALMDAHKHKTLATLRRDGSPRISGTEASFTDGDLWFGSMLGAQKGSDLVRDPRFALHSGSDDPPAWRGDAKISGRAVKVTDAGVKASLETAGAEEPHEDYDLFCADIAEVVVTRLNEAGDRLVIELWRPGQSVRTTERD